MKWFSRDWHEGRLSAEQSEDVQLEYQHHARALRESPSGDVAALLDADLHDGQVESFAHAGDVFEWRILVGDLERGYEWLALRYSHAEVVGGVRSLAELRLTDPGVELLYDEVDVDRQGRAIHRVLVWPEGEVWIRFRGATIMRAAARPEDRR